MTLEPPPPSNRLYKYHRKPSSYIVNICNEGCVFSVCKEGGNTGRYPPAVNTPPPSLCLPAPFAAALSRRRVLAACVTRPMCADARYDTQKAARVTRACARAHTHTQLERHRDRGGLVALDEPGAPDAPRDHQHQVLTCPPYPLLRVCVSGV